jgi:hypothetical protein
LIAASSEAELWSQQLPNWTNWTNWTV